MTNASTQSTYEQVRQQSVKTLVHLLHEAILPYSNGWLPAIKYRTNRKELATRYDAWWHDTMEAFQDCFRYSIQTGAVLPEELKTIANQGNKSLNTAHNLADVGTVCVKLHAMQEMLSQDSSLTEEALRELMTRISKQSEQAFIEARHASTQEATRALNNLGKNKGGRS